MPSDYSLRSACCYAFRELLAYIQAQNLESIYFSNLLFFRLKPKTTRRDLASVEVDRSSKSMLIILKVQRLDY